MERQIDLFSVEARAEAKINALLARLTRELGRKPSFAEALSGLGATWRGDGRAGGGTIDVSGPAPARLLLPKASDHG